MFINNKIYLCLNNENQPTAFQNFIKNSVSQKLQIAY